MDEGRRKGYSLALKKSVLDFFDAHGGNVSATSQKFGIHRKNIQRWRCQHQSISSAIGSRKVRTRLSKRLRPKIANYPELDKAIVEYITKTTAK